MSAGGERGCICSAYGGGPDVDCQEQGQCASYGHPCHCGWTDHHPLVRKSDADAETARLVKAAVDEERARVVAELHRRVEMEPLWWARNALRYALDAIIRDFNARPPA